ncbi:hypothetical protein V1293_006910 [Bradyrhizobium sp. AZCC 1693]
MRRGLPLQKRMGPGASKHRGARHLRFRRRISGRHQLVSGSDSAWPLRSSPADMFELLKAQRGWQLLMTSTAPRPCDEQGHQSDPVASCSSSRVGRRTCVRFRCVSSRSSHRGANACEVGSHPLRDSNRCSTEMLRQMPDGVKSSQQQVVRPVPGNNVRAWSGGSPVGRGRGSSPSNPRTATASPKTPGPDCCGNRWSCLGESRSTAHARHQLV